MKFSLASKWVVPFKANPTNVLDLRGVLDAFHTTIKNGRDILSFVFRRTSPIVASSARAPTAIIHKIPLRRLTLSQRVFYSFCSRGLMKTTASDLRRQAAIQFVSGNVGSASRRLPLFAFVGLTFTAANSQKEELFDTIRDLHNINVTEVKNCDTFNLNTLEIGDVIGLGGNGAVHKARLRSVADVTNNDEDDITILSMVSSSYTSEIDTDTDGESLMSLEDSDGDFSVLEHEEVIQTVNEDVDCKDDFSHVGDITILSMTSKNDVLDLSNAVEEQFVIINERDLNHGTDLCTDRLTSLGDNNIEIVPNTAWDSLSCLEDSQFEISYDTDLEISKTSRTSDTKLISDTDLKVSASLEGFDIEINPNAKMKMSTSLERSDIEIISDIALEIAPSLEGSDTEIICDTELEIAPSLEVSDTELISDTELEILSSIEGSDTKEISDIELKISTTLEGYDIEITSDTVLEISTCLDESDTEIISDTEVKISTSLERPDTEIISYNTLEISPSLEGSDIEIICDTESKISMDRCNTEIIFDTELEILSSLEGSDTEVILDTEFEISTTFEGSDTEVLSVTELDTVPCFVEFDPELSSDSPLDISLTLDGSDTEIISDSESLTTLDRSDTEILSDTELETLPCFENSDHELSLDTPLEISTTLEVSNREIISDSETLTTLEDYDSDITVLDYEEDVFQLADKYGNATDSDNDFKLAVKMMFNYSIKSNADSIARAMRKETVPIGLFGHYDSKIVWRNGNSVKKKKLSHPNIVEMYGVFVDAVSDLPNSRQFYRNALPPRIYMDGAGRNMTMFLVMKRYDCTLYEYLLEESPSSSIRCLLLVQLLEGLAFLYENGIAHRDLKSNNLLLDRQDDLDCPRLVITDFGGCLCDGNLQLPYTTREIPKGGNSALMPPEIACATPGSSSVLDYRRSDVWTAGAIAYEIFGAGNPFYYNLDSRTYTDDMLPHLNNAPKVVRCLVTKMLSRDNRRRPSSKVAATVLQLHLWSPWDWPDRNVTVAMVQQWLVTMAAHLSCYRSSSMWKMASTSDILRGTLFSRIGYDDLKQAICFLQNI